MTKSTSRGNRSRGCSSSTHSRSPRRMQVAVGGLPHGALLPRREGGSDAAVSRRDGWRCVQLQRAPGSAVRGGSQNRCGTVWDDNDRDRPHWLPRVCSQTRTSTYPLLCTYSCLPCLASQTVLHQPTPLALHGYLVSSTLQIGDPSVIANVCGVTTVGDFRPGDMAAGGQGAPLAPYLDHSLLQMYYREQGRVGILVNVGGVSNLSVYVPPEAQSGTLPEACGDRQTSAAFIGFDCGPGIS